MRGEPFERLMAALEHPLVVVAAAHRRGSAACVVGFSSQCSVDPPRYCVYLPTEHRAYEIARRAGHLMVHFLDRRQHALASLVDAGSRTGPDVDAAAEGAPGLRWRTGPDGRTPRLHGVDAWLFGRVVARHEAGDHVGFVLDPVRARVPRRLRPLAARDLTS
jgi:flavin reductase (DIM6/NTAB) family NADH-FMN oxidoreductase RutF